VCQFPTHISCPYRMCSCLVFLPGVLVLGCVLASMKERMEASRKLQDLEEITAEISSAVRARLVPERDAHEVFALMTLNADSGKTPTQESSAMPSSELRRNVTRRRSHDRARDSVGSTSVPIQSLVSRKPKGRQKDLDYASETKAPVATESGKYNTTYIRSSDITRRLVPSEGEDSIRREALQEMRVRRKVVETAVGKEGGIFNAASDRSPEVTRRLIPSEGEDPIRHAALNEMWIRKKGLEEDIDEALLTQNSGDFHELVQTHKELNQQMFEMLMVLPASSSSTTPDKSLHLDMESFVIWFAYESDEISVDVWPQMPITLLVDRAVEILVDRGEVVLFEQIILRHEGMTLEVQAAICDYPITSEDIIEVLVSRSLRSPPINSVFDSVPKASYATSSSLPYVGLQDPSLPYRETSDSNALSAKQDVPGGSLSQRTLPIGPNTRFFHDTVSEPQSVSAEFRDIFLPPRDIFGAGEARGLPTAQIARGSLSQRPSLSNQPAIQSSTVVSEDTSFPPRDVFGPDEMRGLPPAQMVHGPGPQRISQRISPMHPNSVRAAMSTSAPQPAFYGVRKGHQVGVCDSWDDLIRRIHDFPRPEFKTFTTWEDAKMYVMQGMWRDMPDNARPWVNPMPSWALPDGNLREDHVSPIGHTPSHMREPDSVGLSTNDNRVRLTARALDQPLSQISIGREPTSNMGSSGVGGGSKGHDKIKQSFKCPRFSGNAKDWKLWHKGFLRFLSIWDLDYVVDPSFFDELPLSVQKVHDNKMVYFILEDATQGSPLAASYVRQAPVKNGFEAYYTLHDGFVFAGSTSSTILLNELANFRFKTDESPTALIMRLEELLQDLEMLPDGAAVSFNDTQRIGYLLGALRHEPEWATVTSSITSCQLRGEMTFRQACNELRFRCEAVRAYDIMDKDIKHKRRIPVMGAKIEETSEVDSDGTAKVLVSTVAKRLNKDKGQQAAKEEKRKYQCLAKDCSTKTAFPLCGLHYHSVVSGKTAALELESNMGMARYNMTTKLIEYPTTVPKDRLPSDRSKGGTSKQ
jgi:hypothetical protein